MAYDKKNEPGMDDPQAEKDRAGWEIDSGFPVGKNRSAHFCDGAGPEVGNPYDYDGLGEEYSAVTYGKEPDYPAGTAKGGSATASEQMPRRSSGGGTVASAPQNYSKAPKAGD